MISSLRIKIIIAVAATVWLIVALLSGMKDGQWTALRAYSVAVSTVTILFLVYDRWAWSWWIVRYATNKPNLNGTWRGVLQSDFLRDGKKIDPIPTVIRIKQTDSSIFVTQFTGESTSTTQLSEFVKESDDRWRLTFVYANVPRPEVSARSDRHQGICELYVTGKGDSLGGSYYTSRKTKGELTFTEWSPHRYGDSASALAGDDFSTKDLFARK